MLSRRAFTAGALSVITLSGADKRRVLVQGHRGARARRPENTLPAFRYAIEHGVDVLELDVAVTKDNVAVVSHDPHMNAAICSGPNPGVAIRGGRHPVVVLLELHELQAELLHGVRVIARHPAGTNGDRKSVV